MAIQSIDIENFTVFDSIKCEFGSGINIIIGENGTGKTHLLKVLYAASDSLSYSTHDTTANKNYFVTLLNACFGNVKNDDLVAKRNKANKDIVAKIYATAENGSCTFTQALNNAIGNVSYKERPYGETVDHAPVFIPAKEMLTHARGLLTMANKHSKDMPFDRTLLDVIQKADSWKVDAPPQLAKKVAPLLEEVIGGTIIQEEGDFYVIKHNGDKIRFSYEAEGVKKFGLLWQLLMTEVITENSILLWDEPEANLNPKLTPVVADVLMELSRNGVQVFLATHDYNLMKYFSIKKKDNDQISFISLYKQDGSVVCEIEEDYNLLEHNAIVEAGIKLLEDDIEGVFGGAN